mmetsp:Transcript_2304/g.8823  ORF Transcript_2304/g.8823 Transcript_2304/m.8823 type:complete len:202 (-) Transcript_2304:1105-1710(-)
MLPRDSRVSTPRTSARVRGLKTVSRRTGHVAVAHAHPAAAATTGGGDAGRPAGRRAPAGRPHGQGDGRRAAAARGVETRRGRRRRDPARRADGHPRRAVGAARLGRRSVARSRRARGAATSHTDTTRAPRSSPRRRGTTTRKKKKKITYRCSSTKKPPPRRRATSSLAPSRSSAATILLAMTPEFFGENDPHPTLCLRRRN